MLHSITVGCQAESIRAQVTLSCAMESIAWTLPFPGIWDLGSGVSILSLIRELSPASSFPPIHNFCLHTSHLLTPGLRRPVGHLSGDPALSGGRVWVGSSPATKSMSGSVGEGAREAGGGNKGTAPGGGV